jgi:heme oxygenase
MHDALDTRLNLGDRWSLRDYVAFLRATLSVLGPLEAPLRARLRAAGVSVALPQAASIERDLQTLGQDAAAMPRVDLPSIESPAQALGAAYVFIGSTLGAPVIARELRKWLSMPEHSLTYLAPRERAGVSWKHFLDTVVSFDAHATEQERLLAAQTAQDTFRAFDDALTSAGLR